MKQISRLLNSVMAGTILLSLPGLAAAQHISHIGVSPSYVVGGQAATGGVEISDKAPSGGLVINLASDQTSVTVPSSVTVAAGKKTATFAIVTSPVASANTANITGTDPNSKTAKTKLKVYPAYLKSFSLSPETVVGGNSSTGTVTLSGNTAAGGLVINLLSNEAYAQVPASVTVPAGASTVTFTVTTTAVTKNGEALIVATDANGVFSKHTLKVTAPVTVDVKELNIGPDAVISGGIATGTVRLNSAAPTGGFVVTLASDQTSVQVPSSVTVPAGAKQATFTVTTSTVTATSVAKITATDSNNKSVSSHIAVMPLKLVGLGISPKDIVGGTSTTGAVLLNAAAPTGGVVISLSSSSASVQVPGSVTIPAGQLGISFPVTTSAVTARTQATITAMDPAGHKVTFKVSLHV